MKAELFSFGEIVIAGERYAHDVVIEKGQVRKRKKKPSKAYRDQYGHTPLSAKEHIPWHGKKLYIGTGTYGKLPITRDVYQEAEKKGVTVIAKPTIEMCSLLKALEPKDVNAIVHVTC